MSYFPCAKLCWTKLTKSVSTFTKRTVSQFEYDVKNCWENTYRHCLEDCDCYFCWCRIEAIACIVWQTVKNIVCTIVHVVVLIISIIIYIIVFIIAIVRCIVYPCPLESTKAPEINSCDDLFRNLRGEVNEELSWGDKFFGFFGTPFKETGLSNSWDEYDYWVIAKGEVIHVAYSTDGLETIDIRLITLAVFDSETKLITAESVLGGSKCNWTFTTQNPKFIRAEVFPQVLLTYTGARPKVSNKVVVKGRLFWDRDGFLEIHPKYGSDLQIVS